MKQDADPTTGLPRYSWYLRDEVWLSNALWDEGIRDASPAANQALRALIARYGACKLAGIVGKNPSNGRAVFIVEPSDGVMGALKKAEVSGKFPKHSGDQVNITYGGSPQNTQHNGR